MGVATRRTDRNDFVRGGETESTGKNQKSRKNKPKFGISNRNYHQGDRRTGFLGIVCNRMDGSTESASRVKPNVIFLGPNGSVKTE